MEGYDATTFGALNAADYDALHDPGTTDACVALIADLAPGKRLLELAIGTGRVALPLAQQGFAVTGIEASYEMIAKLREKPGSDAIAVTCGDIADVPVTGPFDHAFLVFNTLFNLQTQAAQISCFANTAAQLTPAGTFLIEAFVPRFDGFRNHQKLETKRLDMGNVWLEAVTHDPVEQVLSFQRIRISDDGIRLVPLPMLYAYPPEIDLMARLAGLQLVDRWGGWDKSPFTAESSFHISVYRKPADA
ncbi:class I SAM-dependent methyltransferase [Yoonia sp. SS1-5]|uniref:Class I SAM-dependent methyltransferase n=1 Tax=Yoonia rhodophyticola TaxID=3137370 RepID=A0AAN0NJA0_9RHOB